MGNGRAPRFTGKSIPDGVEDVPHVGLAGPPAAGFWRDVGLDQGPLGVGEIAGVMVHSHTMTTSATTRLFTLWDIPLNNAHKIFSIDRIMLCQ